MGTAEHSKARRERLAAEGRCIQCAGHSRGAARCDACRAEIRERYKDQKPAKAEAKAPPASASMAYTLAHRIGEARATIQRAKGAAEKTGFVSAAILEKIDAALRGA